LEGFMSVTVPVFQQWVQVAAVGLVGVAFGGCSTGDAVDSVTSGAPSGRASSVNSGAGSTSPGTTAPGDTQLYVSLGTQHGCAVTSAGGVKCWGLLDQGQLGNGTATPANEAVPAPVAVIGLDSAMVAVAAGGHHSCALGKDGGMKCWGENRFGQLGNDSTEDSSVPVEVVGLPAAVVEVQAGFDHTCAKLEDGTLWCWGGNRQGELGDGSGEALGTGDAHIPREVPGLGPVRAFSLGAMATCAVTQAGSAKCWGDNRNGKLGTGTTESALSPVQVVGLETGVTQISANGSCTCAVMDLGTAKCWGQNTSGQLGNATTEPSLVPVDVIGLSDATLIQVGYEHACALLADATVKCWGSDTRGELGSHRDADNARVPGPGLSGVVQLSTAGLTNCTVLSSPATIECWGTNSYGELGDDRGSYSPTPRTLPGF
jgi:alpha-tubulin suppressor-like RCC1 family protein